MAIFHTIYPLILASGSPRRQELLRSVGINYSVRVSPSEVSPDAGELPQNYALRAARGKAETVLAMLGEQPQKTAVLAADTIVVLQGRILGKPASHAQAFEMLQDLAGQTHTVFTACSLLVSSGHGIKHDDFVMQSRVSMWAAPQTLLKTYAGSEEPMDKAGAYAVQGAGAFLIRSIEGSWSNVVGLPLSEVIERLLQHNIIIPAKK